MSSDITVKALDEIIVKILELEAQMDAKDEEKLVFSKENIKLEALAVQHLKDLEREEYDSPMGKVSIKEKWSVTSPQTDQDKELLFGFLRERGIFTKYVSVNSKSLQSLYGAEWEAAKARGEGLEFSIPGISAPNLFEKFECKESKKSKAKKVLSDG